MGYRVELLPGAVKQLKKLDGPVRDRIRALIDRIQSLDDPRSIQAALGAILFGMRPQDALAPTLLGQGLNVILCDRALEGMGGTLAQVVAAAPADASGSSNATSKRRKSAGAQTI